jgi:hypothetical protein
MLQFVLRAASDATNVGPLVGSFRKSLTTA